MTKLITQEVLPTAAKLACPAQRPTTTTSAVLNSSCKRLEAISGRLKSRIFPNRGPCVISTVPAVPWPELGRLV